LKILKELNTDCQMTQVTILLINLTQQISEVPRELSWQAPVMKTKGECYWCVRPMILATEEAEFRTLMVEVLWGREIVQETPC
jgi:hypothetical protein